MVLTGQDFDLVAGDDGNLNIHVQEEDVNGVLQDVLLTGATITWALKESPNSATALVTKVSTTVTEIEILDQVAHKGEFVVYLDPADTTSLLPDKYFYGAVVLDIAVDTHTVTEGYITLLPKVI